MLKALIYISKSEKDFDGFSLMELEAFATQQNSHFSITGYLSFHKGIFLQYIEGPAKSLEQLYTNINRDQRHTIITTQHFSGLQERLFGKWAMKVIFHSIIDHDTMIRELLQKKQKYQDLKLDIDAYLHSNLKGLSTFLGKYDTA